MKKLFAIAFLLIAPCLFGQSFVQSGGPSNNGTTCNSCVSNSVSFGVNEGSNHLIVAGNEELYPVGSPTKNPNLSDLAGNVWVKLFSACSINFIGGQTECTDIWATCASVAGAETVTWTQPNGNTNTWMNSWLIEWSGVFGTVANACVISSQPLPRQGCTGGCGSTSNTDSRTMPAHTLVVALSNAFGGGTSEPTASIGTNRSFTFNTSGGDGVTVADDVIGASPATIQPTWTYSSNTGSWNTFMVGFGPAATIGPLKKRAIIF